MSEQSERVAKLGESIATYMETAINYGSWGKREVAIEAVRLCCEDARDETLRVIHIGDAWYMSAEERRAFREDGIVPVGWRWCPDCNGEGRVTSMSVSYPHGEQTHDCQTCAAERGIVPDA